MGNISSEPESDQPYILKCLLEQATNAIIAVLQSNVIGIYLTGSAVLGDWHDGKSDIDLTVVVKSTVPKAAIPALEKHIKKLESKAAKVKFEIQYIPVLRLEKAYKEAIEPFLAYYDKKHHLSHFNFNPVTWYMLQRHGAVLWGRPIEQLGLKVTRDELCAYVYQNVNTYWMRRRTVSGKICSAAGILSLSDGAVEWCVCGLSRMYYTLREKDIISKAGALAYMMNRSPQAYQNILKEAQAIRAQSGRKVFASRIARRASMLKYMDYAIGLCRRWPTP